MVLERISLLGRNDRKVVLVVVFDGLDDFSGLFRQVSMPVTL